MASKQLLLVLFCGEIGSCLCAAAAPHHTATSPRADKALLNQLQATGPSSHQSDTALAPTEPQPFPGQEEAGDGSWVAAVMLGSILIGMALAIVTILLWKCCMRPALAESHWAGRSPFVDGDTPDLLTDPEQGTKRSSVLFMLPWRLKQGTSLQEEPAVSENPPQHTTSSENGQAALGCSPAPAPVPVPVTDTAPAPAPAPASSAAASCPAPDPAPECSDLPPPPEWLREPPEQPSLDPHEHPALHLEAEEPHPPAPELLIQETQETLPQPEHPL
ncbi:protein EVI2B [Oenanthe melanoleuca]|uniref:protein EVI2B n=1 Tax=Oenanthe melanoleuca TaxID=2939378 RepID=UPI0024C1A75F|nr:protein EVI2B [Oenanthe melanoleuca]XP_056362801.1 protein EVI2B [Oenanthe melanoleuca]